jgi:hypothetical protein
MTKINSLRFENQNSDPFHLQFYKNSCQTIKKVVLQLDWGWATPTYMNFYYWNSYIKIRGQPRSHLDSSGLTRKPKFHRVGNHRATVGGVTWVLLMKTHQMIPNYLLAKYRD